MILFKKKAIQTYFVNCALDRNNEIDFTKNVGIIYPNIYDDKTIYYDIKLREEMKAKEYKTKFKNLGFFYGEFINHNKSSKINIEED